MPAQYSAFATCPKNLEGLLKAELSQLGAAELRETVAGVAFAGSLECLYRVCLWSRLANRVLLVLTTFSFHDQEDLYHGIRSLSWRDHMLSSTSFAIDFSGKTNAIKHTHYGALKVKDAVVDYFRDTGGTRPSVDTSQPALRLNVRAARGQAIVSIDLSGESLHKRGYRKASGPAPLKENLAAALLVRAAWSKARGTEEMLVDPMCGSGTLLIEAAAIATDVAPGLIRRYWGFTGWLGHEAQIWTDLMSDAFARRAACSSQELPGIVGYDASGYAIQSAEKNIRAAGFAGRIRVRRRELRDLKAPSKTGTGLVVTNPPFGQRLGNETTLGPLYKHLGERLRAHFEGWQVAIMTANPEHAKTIGIRAQKSYRLFNGALPARLLVFDIKPNRYVTDRTPDTPLLAVPSASTSENVVMLANRLKKNLKRLAKWSRKKGISCFRLYDADIPQYAVAIDLYTDCVHIAEYQAPTTIDPALAAQRMDEIVTTVQLVFAIERQQIVVKRRKRQPGAAQYQQRSERGELIEVTEDDATLLVNLHDYLDTGLFLDHRPVRKRIAELANGKRFLNLYCYTGAATVHAALGGARFSTSVDLSPRYLEWAGKNLARNGIGENRHKLVERDCWNWLAENEDSFDLVLLDPPTFSNSKRTTNVLDLQRDHVPLLTSAMRCLSADGLLIFSTNSRKFKLDSVIGEQFVLQDVTRWSLDEDFRGSKSHKCWFVKHR